MRLADCALVGTGFVPAMKASLVGDVCRLVQPELGCNGDTFWVSETDSTQIEKVSLFYMGRRARWTTPFHLRIRKSERRRTYAWRLVVAAGSQE